MKDSALLNLSVLIQGWNAEIVVTTFSNEFVICIIVIRVTSKNIIFINE